jgi:hypothetical protein
MAHATPWFEDLPLDFVREETRAAEHLLITAYPTTQDALTLAQNAGLNLAKLNQDAKLTVLVRDILNVARASDRLTTLIDTVLTDPDQEAFHERFRQLAAGHEALLQTEIGQEPHGPGPQHDTPTRRYRFVETRLSGQRICTAVWNRAGDAYAVGTADRIELYDCRGTFQSQFPAPEACYLAGSSVQWAPSDRSLAIQSDEGQFYVIEVSTGKCTRIGPGLDEILGGGRQYSWSRDGSTIAVAAQEGVYFTPAGQGDAQLLVPGLHFGVSMSPTDDIFVISSTDDDGPLFQIRNASNNAVIADVGRVADTGYATSLDFNPAGELVAAAFQDFGIEVWSLPTRSRITTLEAAFGVITDVRWSSNGCFLMVTTHTPQIVRVYDSDRWQLVGELQPHGHETVRRGIGVNAASIASNATVLLVPQGERGIDVFELGD